CRAGLSAYLDAEAQTARRLCWPQRGQRVKNERPQIQDARESVLSCICGLSFFTSAYGAKPTPSPQSPLTQPAEERVSRVPSCLRALRVFVVRCRSFFSGGVPIRVENAGASAVFTPLAVARVLAGGRPSRRS